MEEVHVIVNLFYFKTSKQGRWKQDKNEEKKTDFT